MKTNIKGFPVTRNGKVLKSIPHEVVRAEYQGETIKQNGTYLYFRFKRDNKFVYSE